VTEPTASRDKKWVEPIGTWLVACNGQTAAKRGKNRLAKIILLNLIGGKQSLRSNWVGLTAHCFFSQLLTSARRKPTYLPSHSTALYQQLQRYAF